METSTPAKPSKPKKKRYVKAVGPRLKRLLSVVMGLFAITMINAAYLTSITIAGVEYQNWFYLNMVLLHLILGLLLVVPVIVFGIIHWRNTWNRPNRRAIRVGIALFATANILFISGIVLMRVDIFGLRFEVNQPLARSIAYWAHVLCPLVAAWLFILHRLAGRRIKWKVGLKWATVAVVFAGSMLLFHKQDPRAWNVAGPESGETYFFPSLARTTSGNFIPERVLSNDAYCAECHADVHDSWEHSVHKFASFNNPVYEFSVKGTRKVMMERDGNVQGSRFCAGCHDPVPFFSGAFDDPRFDDPDYDLSNDSLAQAGITCTVCHSIGHVNSVRGNADFTIDEPVHYPFAFSENSTLRWINRQLVKAKPEFHKATFLKPLHRTTEFCGTCHKVHLPPELNNYKWLRGQNHYDAFWLSGVSGQGISSFYYPPVAEINCNDCHMPLIATGDDPNFSSRVRDESGVAKTMDHLFPSANTAIPHLLRDEMRDPDGAIAAHEAFNEGVMRVDIFGIKPDATIDAELVAPIRPAIPALQPGRSYLVEVVIRTVKMGHVFTQGTSDSNEVWLEVEAQSGEQTIGRSGALHEESRGVDPWSHFVNSFVIDREGNRIDRRNAEDIFTPLYNHQIPPGAADVIHYKLDVPREASGEITFRVQLRYRKFDNTLMEYVTGDAGYVNDLPIMELASDSVSFPIAGSPKIVQNDDSPIPEWQRWNDYGIGLLRKGQVGQLREAARAFAQVEALGRPDGPLNLARVYIQEGLVQEQAPLALKRAAEFTPPANEWSLLWFGAIVAESNGDYDTAIQNLREILKGGFTQAEGRGFNFAKDYRVLNRLGNALYQRALLEMGDERERLLTQAFDQFSAAMELDPENVEAIYGLKQIYADRGDGENEQTYNDLHAKYKPNDNARDYAVAEARRRYPAANKAAEAVVIYDLSRALDTDAKEMTDGQ